MANTQPTPLAARYRARFVEQKPISITDTQVTVAVTNIGDLGVKIAAFI